MLRNIILIAYAFQISLASLSTIIGTQKNSRTFIFLLMHAEIIHSVATPYLARYANQKKILLSFWTLIYFISSHNRQLFQRISTQTPGILIQVSMADMTEMSTFRYKRHMNHYFIRILTNQLTVWYLYMKWCLVLIELKLMIHCSRWIRGLKNSLISNLQESSWMIFISTVKSMKMKQRSTNPCLSFT